MAKTMAMTIDDEWKNFISPDYEEILSDDIDCDNEIISNLDFDLSEAPKSSDIYISTKSKIAYLNREINLKEVFWNVPVIPYAQPTNGVIKKQMKFKSVIQWFLAFVLIIGLIHYPSIQKNHKISMLDKEPKGINANWTELNYLHVASGSHSRPTWDEVLAYKKTNGENSLPNNFLAAIVKDKSLAVKNFVYKLYLAQLSFVGKLGLFYIFFLLYVNPIAVGTKSLK
jgi:hypothetical protein